MGIRGRSLLPLAVTSLAVASCSAAAPSGSGSAHASAPASPPRPPRPALPRPALPRPALASPAGSARPGTVVPGRALPAPAGLVPFGPVAAGQGAWRPAGRPVAENGQSVRAVYETTLIPPGGTQSAGIAWLDTGLLAARLYSGSVSPGGGPYRYTAPIRPAQAATLVAAFNGGFKMNQARGGYYTEGRMIDPLRAGAASLVIYADGSVGIGAWGRDVTMTPQVVSVRQNLLPLVAGGRPTPRAASARWQAWGSTCGAASCGPTVPGIEHQWRSGLGITADGALVYVAGPALDPLQLAQLLAAPGRCAACSSTSTPTGPCS